MNRRTYKKSLFHTNGASSFLYQSTTSLLHQPVHIPCNLLVSDLGVDLRAGNGRMSHHLSDALYRDVLQRRILF